MAARLLFPCKNEHIQHTLQDDMESFIHVLTPGLPFVTWKTTWTDWPLGTC